MDDQAMMLLTRFNSASRNESSGKALQAGQRRFAEAFLYIYNALLLYPNLEVTPSFQDSPDLNIRFNLDSEQIWVR